MMSPEHGLPDEQVPPVEPDVDEYVATATGAADEVVSATGVYTGLGVLSTTGAT